MLGLPDAGDDGDEIMNSMGIRIVTAEQLREGYLENDNGMVYLCPYTLIRDKGDGTYVVEPSGKRQQFLWAMGSPPLYGMMGE